jgi:hypothetical protein
MNSSSPLSHILAGPILSCLDAQSQVNSQTLDLINTYTSVENGQTGMTKYIVNNTPDTNYEIAIPTLTMVNIPTLVFNKVKISMHVKKNTRDKNTNTDLFSLSSLSSKNNTYKIDIEISQNTQPPLGIHRLNTLLMENVITTKL